MVSLRRRILIIALLAAIIPIVPALIWMNSGGPSDSAALDKELIQKASLASDLVSLQLHEFTDHARRIAVDLPIMEKSASKQDQNLSLHRFANIAGVSATAYDSTGAVLISVGTQVDLERHADAYRAAVDSKVGVVSDQVFLNGKATPSIVCMVAPWQNDSAIQSIAVATDLEKSWQRLDSCVPLSAGQRLVVTDGLGRQIYSRDRSDLLKAVSSLEAGSLVSSTGDTEDGQRYAGASIRLPNAASPGEAEWRVWIFSDHAAAGWGTTMLRSLLPIFLAFGAAIAGAMYLTRWLRKPISELSETASLIASGRTDVRAESSGVVELEGLINSVNEMVSHVLETETELRSAVDEKTTRLRLSQETLQGTTVQMRAAFESLPEGIVVVGRDGRVIEANTRILDLFKMPGRRAAGIPASKVLQAIGVSCAGAPKPIEDWRNFQNDPTASGELEWHLSVPDERILDVYTAPVRMGRGLDPFARVWIFRDITEMHLLEEELRQSQKMEAVGRLAGGIAHDFNNLLTAITGNLGLSMAILNEEQSPPKGVIPKLNTALTAADRGAALVRQMLGYSRRSRVVPAPTCLSTLVDTTHGLLRHSISPKIQIRVERDPEVWDVMADANQIEQVLMNICVNARDAIGETGTITIASFNVEMTNPPDGRQPGSYVRTAISDDGEGIDKEVIDKIFDPFFTTKGPGEGTGLGLSMCYGILEQHGGWIEVNSVVGEGTTFEVYLPKSKHRVESPREAINPSEGRDKDRDMNDTAASNQTVLIADDEAAVCQVAETILKTKGYEVITASDGQQAVDLCVEHGSRIDVAILDLTMPVLTGKEAFQKMVTLYPDLPVLICSGYLVDLDDFKDGSGVVPAGFVQKPYALKQFLSQVEEAIREHPREQKAFG